MVAFMLMVGDEAALDAAAARYCALAANTIRPLMIARRQHGVRLLAAGAVPIIALGTGPGIAIGELYWRDATRIASIDDAEADEIVTSRGRWLIGNVWGGYLAVFPDGSGLSHRVLRDPSGAFPVYYVDADGFTIYFNDVEPLVQLGLVCTAPDPAFARHWLGYPNLRTARTGLADVRELLPGTSRTRQDARIDLRTLWSPWDHAAAPHQITNFDEAVAVLGDRIAACTRAMAGRTGRAIIELSGGLDSSVVAALAPARAGLSAMTFWTHAADGDERYYARATAAHCGLPLAEIDLPGAAAVTPTAIQGRGVRPGTHPALQAIDAAFDTHAAAVGAEALLTGTGGDNVFCYLTTAAPAVDAFRTFGPGRSALATLVDVAELNGTTLWTAARFAWRKARRPAPAKGHWPASRDFLASDAVPSRPDGHPWLDYPDGALPGQIEHVAAILRIHAVLDTNGRARRRPMLHPLLAQPVVETCLRIPSWLWIKGGRNRAVARAAFAGSLPAAVIARRGKGRLESVSLPLYLAERRQLRELLCGGWLARHGIIDVAAVDGYLTAHAPPADDRYFRIFDLVSIERWARGWLEAADAGPMPATARTDRL